MGLRSEVEALAFGRRNDTFEIEKNGGNGAEKSYTLRGGGLCWERLGDERSKLRELPPECLCFPWEVGYSVGRRV